MSSSAPESPARRPRTTLHPEEWLRRHGLISVAFVVATIVVVGWSAAVEHSGAQLLAYVAPLLACGAIATRPRLAEHHRELALAVGLTSAAALVGSLAADSIIAPAGYGLALALVAQYERRSTLAFALGLLLLHEAAFGTVVPDGRLIDGIPALGTPLIYAAIFTVGAVVLTMSWGRNDADRTSIRRQGALISDQLAVSEIVLALDVPGHVTLVSDHGLMVLGRAREEVIGQDFFGLVVDPEKVEAARAGHRHLIQAGAQLAAPAFYEFEHAIYTGDGERRIFLWRVTVSMDDGEVTGTVASGFDITEVRRAQRQLQRDHRDLEQLQLLARAVARESDARDAVVSGIRTLVDGNIAGLFEPTPDGEDLVLTRVTDPDLLGAKVPLHGSPSGVGVAYASAEPFFVADAVGHPLIQHELRVRTGSVSFLYHPVILDGQVAAVIAVGWQERVDEISDRRANLVALAAEEAASALGRLGTLRSLEEAAMTDSLTGIPNRRAFDQLIVDAMHASMAGDRPLSLALMDLNGFKLLNDSEGHAAGDRVLKESASLWHDELRPSDVIARLGGDEFAVLLPNCGADHVGSVADRLRRALRHEPGCGVGVAVWDGVETTSSLMRRADEALYTDKAGSAVSRIAAPERVEAVFATGLLDEEGTDPRLDQLSATVAALLGVPVSLVSVMDTETQTFVGRSGLETMGVDGPSIPWAHSYCRHPVATGRPLVVNDAASHPLVANEVLPIPDDKVVGAYAGFPIIDDEGHVLGSMCAVDVVPRDWTSDELATLRSVAARATQIILDDMAARRARGAQAARRAA